MIKRQVLITVLGKIKKPFVATTVGLLSLTLLLGLMTVLVIERNDASQNHQTVAKAYQDLEQSTFELESKLASTSGELASASAQLALLLARDEYQINLQLEEEIKQIKKTYTFAVQTYEKLLELTDAGGKTETLSKEFTKALLALAGRDYTLALQKLTSVAEESKAELAKIAATAIPKNVPTNNTPPSAGYQRQAVEVDGHQYLLDIVAADLSSTRVIVDTASDNTCGNECPVLSLGDYVSRNGAYAGINGSYFCPASYPSCAGKTNSFDTLLMNKNKVYFNSDNNVYSTVPAVIFGSGWVRFVGQSLEWGRDTSIDGMIANQPLLVSGGNSVFGGDGDPKKGSVGSRSFVANKGNTVYIGIVKGATVAQAARVLATMGMDNALNLDSGGSTALWHGGYKAGPGRNIPNAILFVRK